MLPRVAGVRGSSSAEWKVNVHYELFSAQLTVASQMEFGSMGAENYLRDGSEQFAIAPPRWMEDGLDERPRCVR